MAAVRSTFFAYKKEVKGNRKAIRGFSCILPKQRNGHTFVALGMGESVGSTIHNSAL